MIQAFQVALVIKTTTNKQTNKKPACQCRRCKKHKFDPWVKKIPWRRTWQLTPVFLPGKSMDRGAWWAPDHGVTELDMTKAI